MPSVKIRYARQEDLQAILGFQQEMAFETEKKKLNQQIVSDGVLAVLTDRNKGFYIVAEVDGRVIASLMVTKDWSDWRNAFFYYIQSVFVKPEFRKRGIFSKLYAFVKKMAKHAPAVCGIRLYVEKDNGAAKRTYESVGMQLTDYHLYEHCFEAEDAVRE